MGCLLRHGPTQYSSQTDSGGEKRTAASRGLLNGDPAGRTARRIVLLRSQGNKQANVAKVVGVSINTVSIGSKRFDNHGTSSVALYFL